MAYGICKVCGCTDKDPCFNPRHGNCWWTDETHELCSHCADRKIAEDPETIHCINSSDTYKQSLAERLVCRYCKHWHKTNDCSDVEDENAYGNCDTNEWGSYGSDPMCVDFDEREED